MTARILLAILPVWLGQGAELHVRKNAKELSASERSAFVEAVLKMKELPSRFDPAYNAYDWLVRLHKLGFDNHLGGGSQIHMSPPFFPWHREFLRAFELELNRAAQSNGVSVTLTTPYWDWTDANCTLAVFGEDFLGGNGSGPASTFTTGLQRASPFRVRTGPFATRDDRTTRFPINTSTNVSGSSSLGPATAFLQRSFATHQVFGGPAPGSGVPPAVPTTAMMALLPTTEQVAYGLAMNIYDQAPWDYTVETNLPYLSRTTFRNFMEGHTGDFSRTDEPFGDQMHGRGHLWVGGNMAASSSPNDPVFWLHHANLDRIWAEWQDRHGIDNFPAKWYFMDHSQPDMRGIGRITDVLYGFTTRSNYVADLRVSDTLDLRASGIRYQTQPNEILRLRIADGGSNWIISFPTTSGFQYQFEATESLAQGWAALGAPIAGNVSAISFEFPKAGAPSRRFFRAAVQRP
jgi:tyrosinase